MRVTSIGISNKINTRRCSHPTKELAGEAPLTTLASVAASRAPPVVLAIMKLIIIEQVK